ncbi:uncharacterized protein G2W53_020093 [Senna tora]|uniref:Uncharacterized protein n=1 Tax=Senna tora TaxID=362788 RepID=A0A834U2V8_9FABA|nr:uncharacterized protein G2W53_020093 [Senna tora]
MDLSALRSKEMPRSNNLFVFFRESFYLVGRNRNFAVASSFADLFDRN